MYQLSKKDMLAMPAKFYKLSGSHFILNKKEKSFVVPADLFKRLDDEGATPYYVLGYN